MTIDTTTDLDYPLIEQAFAAQKEATQHWPDLERIYRNIARPGKNTNHEFDKKANELNRSSIWSPIARDTVLIKRSIFSSSFQTSDEPLSIQKLGDEDNERAKQLRIASKYLWEQANPYVELNKAMLRMFVFEVGATFLYFDGNKKRMVIEEVNPTDIAFDPGARNASDVQFLAYRYKKTAKEIRQIIASDKGKKPKEKFYNKLKDHAEFFGQEFDPRVFRNFDRYELKEIYIRTYNGWLCKTYYPARNLLLRVVKFKECPFQWGYAREKLSSVDDALREKEIMVYGESEINFIKEHVEAINKRRNQHFDIVEEQINPSIYLGTGAKANPSDLKRGAGAKIPVGDVNQVRERRAPATIGLHDDLEMLKDDIETTTSVNGLYKAQTSASDRRATGAIAMLSSQGSTRIEEQIMTANVTLFSHLAKSFVRKVYRYVDADTLFKLGIANPLIGCDVPDKEEFDFVVSVKFGSDMARSMLFDVYMQILQVLGQHQNVNPKYLDYLIKKAVEAKAPDDMELWEDMFGVMDAEVPETTETGADVPPQTPPMQGVGAGI